MTGHAVDSKSHVKLCVLCVCSISSHEQGKELREMFSQLAKRRGKSGGGGVAGWGQSSGSSVLIPNNLTIKKTITTALFSIPGSLIKWLGYKKSYV